MGRPLYVVRFSEADTLEAVHRIRNFAEDVFRSLRDEDLGSVPNADTATNEVRIEVASTRQLGRVGQIIRRHLREHNFATAVVERG